MKELSIEEVKKELFYDPLTGEFYRLKTHRAVKAGDVAGSRVESSTKKGKYYIRIGVLGKFVWAHRLVVAYMTGSWPANEVDHLDQNSENNKWANLRECSKKENARNLSPYKSNTSGYPGISVRPNGKYRARLMSNKKSISLGDWDTPEQAMAARLAAKTQEGFHENHC
jgi:hypothetical protein